jgi:uncharacterized lipoprotein YddW (UPF0748 family)
MYKNTKYCVIKNLIHFGSFQSDFNCIFNSQKLKEMKRVISLIVLIIVAKINLQGQANPKRELRGAWITSIYNIDWPSASNLTTTAQQTTFIDRLNEHKATGMNALFVQVRSQCDAMYPSPYDPWCSYLTGTQGTAPSPYYDPLQFMINETKQRGMEFHAWFNPYRALASVSATSYPAAYAALAPSHVAKANTTWTMPVTTISNGAKQILLNPGAPEVWEYIIGTVMHVVRNYDVDGIHFDDYFYTNPALTTFNDDSVFAIHNRGFSAAQKADWRRSNVDTLIKRLNDSIKSVKPWVKFGISPTGIWSSFNSTTEPNGSNTSSGATQHKKDLFANTRLWLQQGWIDYLAPQIYWHTGQTGSDYSILAPWWSNNSFGRHIYLGQAGYKVGVASPASNGSFISDVSQIPNQIRLNRSLSGIKGQIVYSTADLRANRLSFRDSIKDRFYNKPTLVPTMTWKDNIVPDAPYALSATANTINNTVTLNWVNPTPLIATEMNVVKRFAIYRNLNTTPDINNPNHLIAVTNTATTSYIDSDPTLVLLGNTYNYIVTSLDRLHNESVASNEIIIISGVVPLTLVSFDVTKKSNNYVSINWLTNNEINTDHFEIERAINNLNFKKINQLNANDGSAYFDYKLYDYDIVENGIYYYRLKMLDKDGSFTYSDIRKIEVKNTRNILTAFPNPVAVAGKLQLHWSNKNANIAYRIIQLDGKEVSKNKIQFTNGVAFLPLNSKIKAGIYLVQFYKNSEINTLKIVVE